MVFFIFFSNFIRKLCKQTVETLIRHHVRLWRLIWVCTIAYVPKKDARHIGPIARQKFKDNLEFKLQVNSRRLHKVRFNKSQVNVKLKLQVTGRRLHEASLTSLRLSI